MDYLGRKLADAAHAFTIHTDTEMTITLHDREYVIVPRDAVDFARASAGDTIELFSGETVTVSQADRISIDKQIAKKYKRKGADGYRR